MDVPAIKKRLERLLPWRTPLAERTAITATEEQPLRDELLSGDQLALHARALAESHQLATGRSRDKLIPRLEQNEAILVETYDLVSSAVRHDRRIAPAAEWLLDNFYLVEEQIRTARRHLPSSYSRELPRLASGPGANYPRAYAIALELISHADGRVDAASLSGFIASYQTVAPLKVGELWAVPIMLRLALIENLRRVAVRIAAGRRDRDSAADWAEKMLRVVERNPTDLILVLADMARAGPTLSGAFLAELTLHLQGQSPHFAFANSWLEHRVSEQGSTVERLVLAEGQAQAADQVSIGNSINSLRILSSTDWREFVETQSVIERVLREDPAHVYAEMDFATRDRYRHAVEQIARRSPLSEQDVAQKAVGLSRREATRTEDRGWRMEDSGGHSGAILNPLSSILSSRSTHVGYFLIDRGRPALERAVRMRRSARILAAKIGRRFPLFFYLAGIALVTACAAAGYLKWLGGHGVGGVLLGLLAIPAVLCATQLAVGVVNWLSTCLVKPKPLPRMSFREGIPPEHRTLVVVPTMLTSAAAVESLLDGLEVRYLANRDSNLHFALLTDLVDAPEETMPGDEELVRLAREGIEQLNHKYSAEQRVLSAESDSLSTQHSALSTSRFFLFHRSRKWNPQEGVWMGHERKRGKLADLNAALRGASAEQRVMSAESDSLSTQNPALSTSFSLIVGDTSALHDVRYVVMLDTDTQLPRNAAREMAGAMAHPLNRPVLSRDGRRVVEGYGILQPRVGVSLPSSQRSWFVRLFAGESGMDPYTRVVSDVYQDLFGEGSFIGKGIYDVEAFAQTCGQFPENAILSHDLLESAHARSGLLSDIEVYEDFPSRYPADMSRRHRWVRGDWQIGGWLGARVRAQASGLREGTTEPRALNPDHCANPISALSRWKILDNLRRSLVPAALLILLIGSWLLVGRPWVAFLVLAVLAAAPLLAVLSDLLCKPSDLPVWAHLRLTAAALGRHAGQFLFAVTCLPYEAYINLDAVIRTLVRLLWTRRRLLEWRVSSEAERDVSDRILGFVRSMWAGPAVSVAAFLLLAIFQRHSLPAALPLLGLWLASPVVAWRLSRPIAPVPVRLTGKQRDFLGTLARRTWRFFEDFVTEAENWLPPDNIQEQPAGRIASRTSPTNIGVALLSNLAAHDFGYISAGALLDRTQKTFATLGKMEGHRGHFYNWYDTRSLRPLNPLYVSMVDSGNLAGHLLVLRQGLLELIEAGLPSPRIFDGLRETLRALRDTGGRTLPPEASRTIDRLEAELDKRPGALAASAALLKQLVPAAAQLRACVGPDAECQWWAAAFERSCLDHLNDLAQVAPWIVLPPPPESLSRSEPFRAILSRLDGPTSLQTIAELPASVLPSIDALGVADRGLPIADSETSVPNPQSSIHNLQSDWLAQRRRTIIDASRHASDRIRTLQQLAARCQELADMDFTFLYDKSRELFSIGYNVRDHRLDGSFYDLLASEARLGSFVTIAQGQFGQEHWFALGRMLTSTGGATALLSWSGSMFEYLMPLLVMPAYDNTLLDQTCKAIVRRQIRYGRQRGVPWGISESGYNTIDLHQNYQYRAFGVPGLGLKRGLAEDLVIAPYASAMALMVAPEAACRNLQRLDAEGQSGAYGLYEAIDYTPSRLPPGGRSVSVRQFMAHHQGMSLLALASVLLDKPMQRRFSADPMLRAADLLLQERVPKATVPVFPHAVEASATRSTSAEEEGIMRVFTDPGGPGGSGPEVHLLSNGRYHVVVTSAGGGYSRWGDVAVTRWREDATRDCWGTFCYLRDVSSGAFWSTAWQPTLRPTKRYEAIFTQARAEFRRRDEGIETHTEISVSPEDDIELRRTTITNRSESRRTIEITSYAEVVLAQQAQDLAHPAFSNLFVQTELVRNRHAILCTRRPRSAQERPPWMVHLMTVRGAAAGEASFETDRTKFIGRGRTLASPAVMDATGPLSNSQGAVIDPIVAVRQVIHLEPNTSVRVDMVTGVGETREAVTALMEKYHDSSLADRAFELAWTHSQVLLRQLNASEADAQAYGRLAGSVIYASSLRRARASTLIRNRRGQSGLWGYGISGDLPIVLVRIRDRAKLALVRQAVQAHAYWRMKGLSVDMVIWNEDVSGYRQTLQDGIMDLIASSPEASLVDKPGGLFVRRGEQMSEDDRALMQTVARVVLLDEAGTLAEQVERRARPDLSIPTFRPARRRPEPPTAAELPRPDRRDLAFYNGLGGFSQDGREYITILNPEQATPAPWVNVIANPEFGTVVSEAGSAYTWSQNSHEFRLTPWHNDPVSDTSGEAIYLRDEDSGRFWSPSPLPARGAEPYVARHGFGYSIFEYEEDGISTELSIYVATDAPVKFARLRIRNRSGRPRRLSVTGYWEWVLGELRNKTLMHVVTELDPVTGALFARNAYNADFADSIVFVDSSESIRTITGDRTEFLGRNGTLANPAAMRRVRLSGRVGAGLDPCAAIQVGVALNTGEERDITFILGAARGEEQARQLVQRFRGVTNAQQALEGVWGYWNHRLGAVYVETPDPAVNFLANGWLVYQVLACRMWARTGFYQSGGAFGFRDQLQDGMALVHAEPALLRQHLLRAASRQFTEGDVQHWWHPPAGQGVRTHFSDDYLWLPYAACRYVGTTGDTGVLEESVPFLAGREVRPEEDAYYDLPRISDSAGTLYDHCCRAIDHGLRFGAHGLPLMGCGDWNDGMNLVGEQGKGESVWLAFFLYDLLTRFAEVARRRGDSVNADRYLLEAGRLRGNIEEHAWDGEWYRRAYFDDGTPLGSATNEECQIDALPQSWSVLSGGGTQERSQTAMNSALRRLVRQDAKQILLLDPPFDKSSLNPGYIKGYVPGVRENGGQYTHAAVWMIMALAAMEKSAEAKVMSAERSPDSALSTQHSALPSAWELFSLINPLKHAATPEDVATYRVEPYVAAADVYAVPPHTGRGGWTWYTGSAGWMYRLITESLLGLRLEVDKLVLSPCLPPEWKSFKIHYRYRNTFYHITIQNGGGGAAVKRVTVDGMDRSELNVAMVDDRREHDVEVTTG